MLLSLLLACASDPLPLGMGESGSPDGGGDTDSGPLPGEYQDALLPGPALVLDGWEAELTDGTMVGEYLLLTGQERNGAGGAWLVDLGEDEARVVGATNVWNVHWICAADEGTAWGTSRDGQLYRLDVGEELVLAATHQLGGASTGVACRDGRVAWGAADQGARVGEPGEAGFPGSAAHLDAAASVQDVLLEGETLWVVHYDGLEAWDLAGTPQRRASVELDGTCRDIAAHDAWLAVACGSGGVHLVDRGDGSPSRIGGWGDQRSARAVAVVGDRLWVAAWTDWILLDASDPTAPVFLASEGAPASAMAVVGLGEDEAWLVDWASPFPVQVRDDSGSEVRVPTSALGGAELTIRSDGPEPLWLESEAGELPARLLQPGESLQWLLPQGEGTVVLLTDDADEGEVYIELALGQALQPGDAAPDFVEEDLDGATWSLADLSGKVAFLGLFEAGCPTCESEVADTEELLQERFGHREDFVPLWAFSGSAEQARDWRQRLELTSTVLVDSDQSLRDAYSPPGTGFARNPRHYVIGPDGVLRYVATTTVPGDLEEAIARELE